MRTLYLDCGMGAAGDMLTAALLELFPERDTVLEKLNAIGIPGVRFRAEPAVKCGITGTHMIVTVDGREEGEPDEHCYTHAHEHEHTQEHNHFHEHEHTQGHDHSHHHHNSLSGIAHLVRDHLQLPQQVREDVLSVYGLLAAAESEVHGVSVEQIHFHEVGTMDALADIAAVCLLLRDLHPDQILASPVHVGCGEVRCAHGILPVPAPATARLLLGLPIYGGAVRGELCTPTGAALLRHFVSQFGQMPVLTPKAIGYGMGRKDFPRANCVRAILGETEDSTDEIVELRCNIDDMTGEDLGFAEEQILTGGALDVFTVPIGMKKSRPGTMLCVLCRPEDRENVLRLIFLHTTTIGVREITTRRSVLVRRVEERETAFGPVRVKLSSGCGVQREKFEYEDVARIARAEGLSLAEIRRQLETK